MTFVEKQLGVVDFLLKESALSERCAERLVARASDFALPARPARMRPSVPPEHVGERVLPAKGASG